jgi:hypothetical protein
MFLWLVAHPTVMTYLWIPGKYVHDKMFHPGAFWKLNTFFSLDGGLNRLKTCSLFKLMVFINAVNTHIPLLNIPLLLHFFAQSHACSNSLAMQPPEGAHVHIKQNGCKSQNMLHILWHGQYSLVKSPGWKPHSSDSNKVRVTAKSDNPCYHNNQQGY